MTTRRIIETDNRDMTTTVLILDNGDTVEINPVAMYVNAIENSELVMDHFHDMYAMSLAYLITSREYLSEPELSKHRNTLIAARAFLGADQPGKHTLAALYNNFDDAYDWEFDDTCEMCKLIHEAFPDTAPTLDCSDCKSN